jgi:hypothetical protein
MATAPTCNGGNIVTEPNTEGIDANLTEFFARRPCTVGATREVLLLAIGSIEREDEILEDLSAETIALAECTPKPRVYYPTGRADTAGADLSGRKRARAYEPPEGYSDAWRMNQYALGVAFHAALSRTPAGIEPQVGIPIGAMVPELSGALSSAISKMTARDPEKRFATPAAARKFIEGIGDFPLLRYLGWACAAFVLIAAATLFLLLRPEHARSAAKPAAPVPRAEMALVRRGPISIEGTTAQVADFYLDIKEVTMAGYLAYAASHSKASPFAGSDYGQRFPNHPVWNVSWQDAADYCAAEGKRLPSEAEWARAYSTGEFAWGNDEPRTGQANIASEGLADAGATAGDRTSSGIFDLAGNLPEWTMDDYPGQTGMKIVRGSAFYLDGLMVKERLAIAPVPDSGRGYLRVGFRCAAN